MRRRLTLALEQARVDAQPFGGRIELDHADAQERRLPEHMHVREVRRQRVGQLVVADAAGSGRATGRAGAIGVADRDNQPPTVGEHPLPGRDHVGAQ